MAGPQRAALSNGPEIKQSPFEWNSGSNPRPASSLTLHGETVLFEGINSTVIGTKGGSPILSKEHRTIKLQNCMYAKEFFSVVAFHYLPLKQKSTGVRPRPGLWACLVTAGCCISALAYTWLEDGGRKQRYAAICFDIISILVMHSPWTGM